MPFITLLLVCIFLVDMNFEHVTTQLMYFFPFLTDLRFSNIQISAAYCDWGECGRILCFICSPLPLIIFCPSSFPRYSLLLPSSSFNHSVPLSGSGNDVFNDGNFAFTGVNREYK